MTADKNGITLGQRVYMRLGKTILELRVGTVSWQGQLYLYGLDMIFREGAQNEMVERICDATPDMFYTSIQDIGKAKPLDQTAHLTKEYVESLIIK